MPLFRLRSNKATTPVDFRPEYTIYVLKCEDSCWYVGMTANLDARYRAHRTGRGAQWTKKHLPLSIHSTTTVYGEEDAKRMESVKTSELILEHGVNKVRGAALTLAQRPYDTRESDVRMVAGVIRKALDMDYVEVREFVLEDLERESGSSSTYEEFEGDGLLSNLLGGLSITSSSSAAHVGTDCDRCGRSSHRVNACYAKTHVDGWKIWNSGCERCGRNNHRIEGCYARTTLEGDRI